MPTGRDVWSDGYVTDVAYAEGAFREMSPAWLSMAAVFHEQPPLDVARGLVYVELGCGYGLTSILTAATCPWAEVWGFDFNPVHIERARGVATASGLTNCHFEEASFADLLDHDDLGPDRVDVITLHGVYSWVSEVNRRAIVEFIRRRLAPGGLVYVSHNVPTGWSGMLPLREVIHAQSATDPLPSDLATRGGVVTLQQLAADGAAAFPLGRREQVMFESWDQHSSAYLAHEYLGGEFRPLMFTEVAAELTAAKCRYVGGVAPTDVALDLRVPSTVLPLVRDLPSVALRETLCDFAVAGAFRRDLYRRGLVAPAHRNLARWDQQVVLIGTGQDYRAEPVRTSFGTVTPDHEVYRPLVEALNEQDRTLGELGRMAALAEQNRAGVVAAVGLLVAGGYAAPAIAGWDRSGAAKSAAGLNAWLIESSRRGQPLGQLAAPALTAGVAVSPLVTIALGEIWRRADRDRRSATEASLARLDEASLPVFENGVRLDDPDRIRVVVEAAVDEALALSDGFFDRVGIRAATAVRERRRDGKR